MTLELWSDAENDGELSCCSAQAVRGARELAHELGMPHLSIDLRAEFRAGVVDHWLSDHAAGLTPNPCVRCNGNVRLDAMLELARRLGSETLATGHYARVEEGADAADGGRRGQGPELCPLGARARLAATACGSRSATCASPRSGRSPGGRASRSPGKRDSQDLCFLAGTRHGEFLERHGGLGAAARADRRSRGRACSASTAAPTPTPSASATASGIGGTGPLYVLATDAQLEHGHRRAGARLC